MASAIETKSVDAHITEEDIKLILSRCRKGNEEMIVENYSVHMASNKMIGFLAEYLKLKVHLKNTKILYFFIKAISRTNSAKADMVKEMKLFDKEALFYSEIKRCIEVPGIKPWCAKFITALNDAVVFEDLNAKNYKLRNKLVKYDMPHILRALEALARFHACSIICENNKKNKTKTDYKLTDDYPYLLDEGGYFITCEWYSQCMKGALEAMQVFSKYSTREIELIMDKWYDVWSTALNISDNCDQKSVICHRDLWNNNLMFSYKNDDNNELIPNDCVFVDFQAVRYQPPASDVMVLLFCNLEPTFRKKNIGMLLNFYHEELQKILSSYNIDISKTLSKEEFLASAEEQKQWGLVVSACIMPQIWMDDDLTTTIFSDSVQFEEILCKNKGIFIKKMMEHNLEYRQRIMDIFEEIADTYCLNSNNK